jgi:hypothetical protein
VNLILIMSGALFAAVYLLNGLIRAIRKNERVGFMDLLLAFLAGLIPLGAVIASNMDSASYGTEESIVIGLGAALVIGGLLITLLELRRPARLRQSRGILAMGTGLLLVVMAVVTPLIAANRMFLSQADALPSPTPGPTQSAQAQAQEVFDRVLRVIARQTGMDTALVAAQLDRGTTVAQMVRTNGGDLEIVVAEIVDIMTEQVRRLVTNGQIDPVRGALGISLMETIVRRGVERDLAGLLEPLDWQADEADEPDNAGIPGTELPPTFTPMPSPTATAARPAIATLMPLPTLARTDTPTPTLTPTLGSPCQVETLFNVNLRARADLESERLATIPFETQIDGFGHAADFGWWYVEYAGQTGWVSAEFVSAEPACYTLAVMGD